MTLSCDSIVLDLCLGVHLQSQGIRRRARLSAHFKRVLCDWNFWKSASVAKVFQVSWSPAFPLAIGRWACALLCISYVDTSCSEINQTYPEDDLLRPDIVRSDYPWPSRLCMCRHLLMFASVLWLWQRARQRGSRAIHGLVEHPSMCGWSFSTS